MNIKVEIDGQVYDVKILEIQGDEVLTEVAGKTYGVKLGEQSAQTQTALPAPVAAPAKQEAAPAPVAEVVSEGESALTLKSPLPGTIVEIKVKAGQAVKNGEVLMILEAMKMKNSIRSLRDGTVAEVYVNSKDQVKHNQPLLRYGA
ncbi:MAG TPA: biotin/lipoyl-containing protein [Anaerolineaceae bacterium]|nr:biotin/lipoyl-containing protein [Anaerolineaceae bacterium]